MNINISDEIIEEIVQQEVAEKLSYRIAKSLYEDSDIDGE